MKINISRFRYFPNIWVAFFAIKVAWMLFGIFIFRRLSTLGDTNRYVSGYQAWESGWPTNSTLMMDTVAGTIASVVGPILVHFFFIGISIYGVYYPLKKVRPTKKQLYLVLILLCLPNVGMWTSVVSKEAVTVFFLGIMLAGAIDLIEKRGVEKPLFLALALYLCAIFKPQYLVGFGALLTYVGVSRVLFRYGFGKLFSLVCFFIASGLVLYVFRDTIDEMSRALPAHFSSDARSTRENTVWVEQYDVFRNAVYGMYIAFTGPTIGEAFSHHLKLFSLIESMVLWGAFFLASGVIAANSLHHRRINIYMLGIFLIPTLWILFMHYPMGALNPGSALRYRSGFIAFLIILFLYCYKSTMQTFQQHSDQFRRETQQVIAR